MDEFTAPAEAAAPDAVPAPEITTEAVVESNEPSSIEKAFAEVGIDGEGREIEAAPSEASDAPAGPTRGPDGKFP